MEWIGLIPTFPLLLALATRSMVVERRLRGEIAVLAGELAMLDRRLSVVDARMGTAGATPAAPELEPPPTSMPAPASPVPTTAVPGANRNASAPADPIVAPPGVHIPDLLQRFEQKLTETWLVWLGGVTLALGSAFLVKLSIDYGLLTPSVRVSLAGLLGIGLCVASERLARREPTDETSPSNPSYVPAALAAAGAATMFAAVYAAHQLYSLIAAGPAFVLLAATAIATVAMSLRHGVFVAVLGLVGAYVVPALVQSTSPQALPLFAYLAFVTAGLLALLRHRAWWWLGWPALSAAFAWAVVWLGSSPDRPDSVVIGIYVLVQLALFAAFRRGVPRMGFLAGVSDAPMVVPLVRAAFGLFAFAALILVHASGFDRPGLLTGFTAAAFLLGVAYRDRGLDDVMATAALLLLAVLATWDLPRLTAQQLFLAQLRMPAEILGFTTACVAAALLLSGGGFSAQMTAPRPGRWATLSVASSALILIIAYWRLHNSGLTIEWSLLALALAGLHLAAATSVARRRNGDFGIKLALAAYAVGVLAGTILAATFALSGAWLTVAIALHLPALGWVEGLLDLKPLRTLALVVAAIVVARLVLNPYLLDYPLSSTPIFNWLLYGYGCLPRLSSSPQGSSAAVPMISLSMFWRPAAFCSPLCC